MENEFWVENHDSKVQQSNGCCWVFNYCYHLPNIFPSVFFSVSGEWNIPNLVNGLSYSFYESKCPNLESIIRSHLKQAFKNDIGLSAGLLRIHFHDCLVQGCDAFVLLVGSDSEPSELSIEPNWNLRPSALRTINELRALVDKSCGLVVSCADVVALAARDSVALTGGPDYKIPLGRRDGLSSATHLVHESFPSPHIKNVSLMLQYLSKINFDIADIVAISGGHTLGVSHCPGFNNRLYPTQDPEMEPMFAKFLRIACPHYSPPSRTIMSNTTFNDIRTPYVFDNNYYVNIVNRQGLLNSDQGLFDDPRTRPIVVSFAENQALFFEKFVFSMVKLGQVSVLTGNQGEIRVNCSVANSHEKNLGSMVKSVWEKSVF